MSWKRSFFAIFFAEGLAIAGFSTSMPVIPLYFQELGVKGAAAVNFWNGITQAGSAIALALFAPIWGALADHYGRRTMLLRAMFGGAVLVGLMSFVTAPWQLFALRLIQGAVTGTVAAATVLTSSIVPESKTGFCLGLLQSAVFVGASTGPLLGGIVSDVAGHRETFLVTSLLLLTAGFLVTFLVHEDFTPSKEKSVKLGNLKPDFGAVVSDKGLISLFIMIFSIQLAGSVITPILPLFLQSITPDVKILGTATGLVLSSAAMTGAAAAAIIGRLSDRVGYWKVLAVCMFGAVILYIPQGFVRSWHELLVLRALDGFFMGGTMPAVNALISKRTPREKRGSVFGLCTSVSSMGMALGPALGAASASFFGYPSVFFITSGIISLSACTVFFVRTGKIRRIAGKAGRLLRR
jgi:DHA1 family multidrug resistance protein-like MFS transporter